ncbi:bifunctional phosphoribosyl-AMP cyclohydrolase/phosphoribosyl-ATP pyrophosphatase [Candidatus Micrarchaeota archaeon CG08_land_8_20_14_0_20_49_17]|nr:MAG: bifunctional phosphoribosyl-AMP cyclohydrolase/phosphoribosyl-ATP pyrophosphatase [Candidatus Micrarchaeota archaeon CG08_land_8_20_14_0_20_49_17]PIU81122.1 MAG: bifunctional phosphoribosyl-AMP cyclohydrolase/phosphoribosyl-ATP pyrophosphatase [Candidatus Micrarchaeota archaeon CG06_land_8_20_14_3_00_50_6]PIZ93318.1 MAG: bifunctional phosphoribosyl-AMP cyclohydrolase/phosphoribosyl-ATP pyrophosphatase [Candidatus Micrarchaeota archaeon CG_4_10_14_0_2_um_filter_49_7]HII53532.1 bifunctiona
MKLKQLDVSKLDFKKLGGLIPAIAQNAETGEVLTLAFMDEPALRKTIETGYMNYYSRTRKKLWKKGEESGNVQKALEVYPDCDSDTLLFMVEQAHDIACHDGTRNCFRTDRFSLERLFQIIKERRDNPKKLSLSYTSKLLKDKTLMREKIMEEAGEVVKASVKEGMERIIYEAGDLLYHLLVLLAGEGIELREVIEELARRRK